MKSVQHLVVLAMAVGLMGMPAWAQSDLQRADSAVRALQTAPDASSAIAAYANGMTNQRNAPALNEAYVEKMVELGMPDLAHNQALAATGQNPSNGLAWGVLAYSDLSRGNIDQAFNELGKAAANSPGDPFVVRTAGQLMAYYNGPLMDPANVDGQLRQSLADVSARYANDRTYTDAYSEAMLVYRDVQAQQAADAPGVAATPAAEANAPAAEAPMAPAAPDNSQTLVSPPGTAWSNDMYAEPGPGENSYLVSPPAATEEPTYVESEPIYYPGDTYYVDSSWPSYNTYIVDNGYSGWGPLWGWGIGLGLGNWWGGNWWGGNCWGNNWWGGGWWGGSCFDRDDCFFRNHGCFDRDDFHNGFHNGNRFADRDDFGRGRGDFNHGRGDLGRGRGDFNGGRGDFNRGRGDFNGGRGQWNGDTNAMLGGGRFGRGGGGGRGGGMLGSNVGLASHNANQANANITRTANGNLVNGAGRVVGTANPFAAGGAMPRFDNPGARLFGANNVANTMNGNAGTRNLANTARVNGATGRTGAINSTRAPGAVGAVGNRTASSPRYSRYGGGSVGGATAGSGSAVGAIPRSTTAGPNVTRGTTGTISGPRSAYTGSRGIGSTGNVPRSGSNWSSANGGTRTYTSPSMRSTPSRSFTTTPRSSFGGSSINATPSRGYTGYSTPSRSYTTPRSNFGGSSINASPSRGYTAPSRSFTTTPRSNLGGSSINATPSRGYTGYSTPSRSYTTPRSNFGGSSINASPSRGYTAPSRSYYAAPRSFGGSTMRSASPSFRSSSPAMRSAPRSFGGSSGGAFRSSGGGRSFGGGGGHMGGGGHGGGGHR